MVVGYSSARAVLHSPTGELLTQNAIRARELRDWRPPKTIESRKRFLKAESIRRDRDRQLGLQRATKGAVYSAMVAVKSTQAKVKKLPELAHFNRRKMDKVAWKVICDMRANDELEEDRRSKERKRDKEFQMKQHLEAQINHIEEINADAEAMKTLERSIEDAHHETWKQESSAKQVAVLKKNLEIARLRAQQVHEKKAAEAQRQKEDTIAGIQIKQKELRELAAETSAQQRHKNEEKRLAKVNQQANIALMKANRSSTTDSKKSIRGGEGGCTLAWDRNLGETPAKKAQERREKTEAIARAWMQAHASKSTNQEECDTTEPWGPTRGNNIADGGYEIKRRRGIEQKAALEKQFRERAEQEQQQTQEEVLALAVAIQAAKLEITEEKTKQKLRRQRAKLYQDELLRTAAEKAERMRHESTEGAMSNIEKRINRKLIERAGVPWVPEDPEAVEFSQKRRLKKKALLWD